MTVPIVAAQGPLTIADLQAVWESSVDNQFSASLFEKGDGSGIEAYAQTWAMLERLSRAVDVTTQAMYILPWSGQTSDPAAGEKRATVTLSVSRSGLPNIPLVLMAGPFLVGETTTDWGATPGAEGEALESGRLYHLTSAYCFAPGDTAEVDLTAEAELVGWGYNNPLPDTLRAIRQIAANFANNDATVTPPLVRCAQKPDTFVPDHVGQYLRFTAGSNVGRVARVVGYARPGPTDGGVLSVARDIAFDASGIGNFIEGEPVTQFGSGATGTFLGATATSFVVQWTSGTFTGAGVITGATSLATAAPSTISYDSTLTPESGTAAWEFVPWGAGGWGIETTNQEQPTGGRLGFLDALGRERNIHRGPAEGDFSYRRKIAVPSDVVSPGAVIRAFNRVLAPVGIQGCLREAGLASLPGFYYDRPDLGDWYDMEAVLIDGAVAAPNFNFFEGERIEQRDPTTGITAVGKAILAFQVSGVGPVTPRFLESIAVVQGTFVNTLPLHGTVSGQVYTPPSTLSGGPDHTLRYRYLFSFLEMRAFFLVTVQGVNYGEFGFAYDSGTSNAYDSSPAVTFYDGYPASAGNFYQTVWQVIDTVRAGGVGFDLVRDDLGCP
jgi:hypothetical protein